MINELHDLVKESGFGATIVLGQPRVNVYNDDNQIIGQFLVHSENQIWFGVYDPGQNDITMEGGECALDAGAIKRIINEFRYR
jgi:hypothetical protein